MHLIIAVEGYREAIERWIKDVEAIDLSGVQKRWNEETKTWEIYGTDTGWRPAVREVKLFNVVVPQIRLDDFLKQVGDGASSMGCKGDLRTEQHPEPALSADRIMAVKALFGQVLGLDLVPQKGYPPKISTDRLHFVILGSLPQAHGGRQDHEFL